MPFMQSAKDLMVQSLFGYGRINYYNRTYFAKYTDQLVIFLTQIPE